MRTFRLSFDDDGKGLPKVIEFEGTGPDLVFPLLAKEQVRRRAILWEDDVRVGTLRRNHHDFWEFVPAENGLGS